MGTFKLVYRNDCESLADWQAFNSPPAKDGKPRCFNSSNVAIVNKQMVFTGKKATAGACTKSPYGSAGVELKGAPALDGYGKWRYSIKCAGSRDAQNRINCFGYDTYFGIFSQDGGWPWEFDFPEVLTRDPNNLCITQHWNGEEFQEGFRVNRPGEWQQFNTYEIEMSPEPGMVFGKVVYRVNDVEVGRQELHIRPLKMIFGGGVIDGKPPETDAQGNVSLSWIRSPSEAPAGVPQIPPVAIVDWVEVYSYVP